jgi:hypothetical protein
MALAHGKSRAVLIILLVIVGLFGLFAILSYLVTGDTRGDNTNYTLVGESNENE